MQFTQKLSKKNFFSISPFVVLKAGIFTCLILYTFWIADNKEIFTADYIFRIRDIIKKHYLSAVAVILLLPVNWGLETMKWKVLVSRKFKISYLQALSGVLTGVSLGFATPHGIGDYFGRILQMNTSGREKLVGAVFVTRISQFVITLIFGSVSFLYFVINHLTDEPIMVSVFLFFITTILAISVLSVVYYKYIFLFLSRFRWIKKYFGLIAEFSAGDIYYILLLSFLRYLVFALQFMVVLKMFNVSDNLLILFLGVNLIFLAKSVIPTLFDLGVREYAAVYFFGAFALDSQPVLFSSLTLWMINILVPALSGTVLFLKVKFNIGR